jgi:hypothetical protein
MPVEAWSGRKSPGVAGAERLKQASETKPPL